MFHEINLEEILFFQFSHSIIFSTNLGFPVDYNFILISNFKFGLVEKVIGPMRGSTARPKVIIINNSFILFIFQA